MSKSFPWYTARGDDGTTGLLGAGRVPKHHPQPEAFGAVDEAGSMIGFARALIADREINDLLVQVQRHCYDLMAELAATPDAQAKFRRIGIEQVDWLANITDLFGQRVSMPREFVVPGDTLADAALDMARTAVRVVRLGTLSGRAIRPGHDDLRQAAFTAISEIFACAFASRDCPYSSRNFS